MFSNCVDLSLFFKDSERKLSTKKYSMTSKRSSTVCYKRRLQFIISVSQYFYNILLQRDYQTQQF